MNRDLRHPQSVTTARSQTTINRVPARLLFLEAIRCGPLRRRRVLAAYSLIRVSWTELEFRRNRCCTILDRRHVGEETPKIEFTVGAFEPPCGFEIEIHRLTISMISIDFMYRLQRSRNNSESKIVDLIADQRKSISMSDKTRVDRRRQPSIATNFALDRRRQSDKITNQSYRRIADFHTMM